MTKRCSRILHSCRPRLTSSTRKPQNRASTPTHSNSYAPLSIKNKVSARDKATMDLIKSDPNHVFTYTRQENGFPHDPREHCVKGVRIMAPHLQFSRPACCPSCSKPSKPKQFTSGDPTKCYGVDDYHFILAYRYDCLSCGKGFNALHPKSIEQLPNNNKLSLDFFLLTKCCVDR